MNPTLWLRIGAVLGGLGVMIGAFGAHGLRPSDAEIQALSSPDREASLKRLDTFETGVRYHMYHAFAIVALGLAAMHAGRTNPALDLGGWLFLAGIVLFSGPLYAIGLGGPKWLGAIAPIGGVAMILGWFALAAGAVARTAAVAEPVSALS